MPAENSRADSVRAYYSGASVDGGTQTDPDASLGNYRSSSEHQPLAASITNAIANVTIDYVSGKNATGAGSLEATGNDTLRWTAPGGAPGASVTITNGQTKVLEDADNPGKYVRVTRTSATNLTGTATVTLTEVLNNLVGFDNVSSAEAAAGDDEYRFLFLKNGSAVNVESFKAWVGTLGTQATTDTAQLSASGAGTIRTGDSFADWPASGFAHVRTSGGTTREIVYYSSRTDTELTVPAAGRALLGTSAGAGTGTDTVDAVPGIRIAAEVPDAAQGKVQTVANESSEPTGRTWSYALTEATGVSVGSNGASTGVIEAAEVAGLWIHRHVVVGAQSIASDLRLIETSFDAV